MSNDGSIWENLAIDEVSAYFIISGVVTWLCVNVATAPRLVPLRSGGRRMLP
jgi:hypothetical protein